MKIVRISAVVATALLTLAACGSGGSDLGAAPPVPVVPAAALPAPEAPAPAAEAPEQLRFSASTVAGQNFDAASLAGRDAVLWFWAPWCSECRREAPAVAAVAAASAGTVSFVGVGGLGPVADMASFVSTYGVGGFAHLNDADGQIWKRFGVTRQPAHAFIDDDGTVEIVRGELSRAELEAKVAALAAT